MCADGTALLHVSPNASCNSLLMSVKSVCMVTKRAPAFPVLNLTTTASDWERKRLQLSHISFIT